MRPNRGFNQAPPEFTIAAGLRQGQSGLGREQRRVQDLQLGTGPAASGNIPAYF